MNDTHLFDNHSQAVDILVKYYVKHKGFKIKAPNTNKNEVFRIRNKETYQMLVLKDDLTITIKRKHGLFDGMITTAIYEEAKENLERYTPLQY